MNILDLSNFFMLTQCPPLTSKWVFRLLPHSVNALTNFPYSVTDMVFWYYHLLRLRYQSSGKYKCFFGVNLPSTSNGLFKFGLFYRLDFARHTTSIPSSYSTIVCSASCSNILTSSASVQSCSGDCGFSSYLFRIARILSQWGLRRKCWPTRKVFCFAVSWRKCAEWIFLVIQVAS